MNDDERTVRALRTALDDRASLVEPSDRLQEILRRAHPAGAVAPIGSARSARSARATRSWLPLAAAAAVLAVVAGVWFGAPDRRDPVPAGTPTPVPSASPSQDPSTAPSPTTSPSPQPTTTGALAVLPVYYLAPVGDDARLARLYREWLTAPGVSKDADEQVRARAAVELAMTAVPAGTDGYLRTWEGVRLEDVAVTTGDITITLSGPGTSAFPEDTERVSVQQLVWTAQAAVGRGTLPVRFVLADGSPRIFGTQPVDRDYNRPASRELYYEDLAPVWVTSPTRGQVLPAGAVTVEGEACVYEATVSWQLLGGGGALVDEGFVNASIGAPGRGTYEIPLGILAPGSYAVRVFEVSPQDGSVSAETTMPFTVR